jgi:hypothetical protein
MGICRGLYSVLIFPLSEESLLGEYEPGAGRVRLFEFHRIHVPFFPRRRYNSLSLLLSLSILLTSMAIYLCCLHIADSRMVMVPY